MNMVANAPALCTFFIALRSFLAMYSPSPDTGKQDFITGDGTHTREKKYQPKSRADPNQNLVDYG